MSVIGHADRAGPLRDYCVGLMLPWARRASSRWRNGWRLSELRRSTNRFCILSAMRRKSYEKGVGQGPRDGAPGGGASRADRSLDHRRHRLSERGRRWGWGGAGNVRPTGQARQLSGRSKAVDWQSPCQPASSSYQAVFATDWPQPRKRRRKAGVPGGSELQAQTGDRASSSCAGPVWLALRARWSWWTPAMAPRPICVRISRRWD